MSLNCSSFPTAVLASFSTTRKGHFVLCCYNPCHMMLASISFQHGEQPTTSDHHVNPFRDQGISNFV